MGSTLLGYTSAFLKDNYYVYPIISISIDIATSKNRLVKDESVSFMLHIANCEAFTTNIMRILRMVMKICFANTIFETFVLRTIKEFVSLRICLR